MISEQKHRFGSLAAMALAAATVAQPTSYDFNNDGHSDYSVSVFSYNTTNPDTGAARIWSGSTLGELHTISGTNANTLFGWSSGSAGDINNDGKADLVVGEPLWSNPLSQTLSIQGRLHVFSGHDASPLLVIAGPYADAATGRYVTGISDWNGDGTPDIASSGWDIADTDGDGIGDDPIGVVHIFSGADGSMLTEITDPTATPAFGYAAFSLGDITGDGLADIAIVDPDKDTGTGLLGQLYIFEGSATASSFDITDAYSTISNTNANIRHFASQVDTTHPNQWRNKPAIQIISLTNNGSGGVNDAEIITDITSIDGTPDWSKGTRPSLKLPGDLNLDHQVDAADVQLTTNQYGTSPHANGIMPIADANQDSVVDQSDVQIVMSEYGSTTDVFSGLWDESRLMAIAAADSGFGSTNGISLNQRGGFTDFQIGVRPVDPCVRGVIITNQPFTIVASLLEAELVKNCNECPSCNDPPGNCYECHNKGTVSGGEISVAPTQPKPGEAFTFTISKWQISGRTRKCKAECGPEGTICPIHVPDQQPYWELERKNAAGNWIVIQTGSSATVTRTETACAEVRLRLPVRTLLSATGNCSDLNSSQKQKMVQVANFTVEVENAATTPTNNKRTTVGVCEVSTVEVVEGVSVDWEVTINSDPPTTSTGVSVTFTAPPEAGTVRVKAMAGANCVRDTTFTVIEPSGVQMNKIGEQHTQGLANSGFCGQAQILPASVSFTGIQIREGVCAATATGSFSSFNGLVHAQGPWGSIGEDNLDTFVDTIYTPASPPNPNPNGYTAGTFHWPIPWEYRCGSGPAKQFTVVDHNASIDAAGTVTTSKGGASSTHAVNDTTETCP